MCCKFCNNNLLTLPRNIKYQPIKTLYNKYEHRRNCHESSEYKTYGEINIVNEKAIKRLIEEEKI